MKIEFIIPTYQRSDHLMTILNSLVSQSSDKWVAHVIADCPPEGTLDKVIDYFKNESRIKFTILEQRYNDWGHTPRNYGLEHATEEWVVMTGEDNYYMPIFVDEFLNQVNENTHFVYCDMVHNWSYNDYIHLPSEPVLGKIDIGSFMSKTINSKQMKLNVTCEQADGFFVEEYLRRFSGEKKHVKKILYVHN